MKLRQEIKALARQAMREQRATAILLTLLLMLMSFVLWGLDTLVTRTIELGAIYWVIYAARMLVWWVMMVNMLGEYIKRYKREQASVGALFTGFGVNFWRKLGGVAWMIFWLSIWALPAIVASILNLGGFVVFLCTIPALARVFAYIFTFNILADCPDVKATQALGISVLITKGYRGDVFIFHLSFVGWYLLLGLPISIIQVLTGVPFMFTFVANYVIWSLYAFPYFYTAFAGLYLELRDQALRGGVVTYEELGLPEQVSTPHENIIIR